ncbi:MAG TPA: type II toxin-antitoxin system RelE/ParE family toxin [Terriglobales bacterium]
MFEVREYLDRRDRSPFGIWFNQLDKTVAAKVTVGITRIALGNFSNVKSVGGVLEYKIDYGPGFRIYFGRDGEAVVILLGGGSKKRQSQDIQHAVVRLNDYQERKLQEK